MDVQSIAIVVDVFGIDRYSSLMDVLSIAVVVDVCAIDHYSS